MRSRGDRQRARRRYVARWRRREAREIAMRGRGLICEIRGLLRWSWRVLVGGRVC
jgi:hypothetical protein